jgi:hypothetical protein
MHDVVYGVISGIAAYAHIAKVANYYSTEFLK